MEKCDTHSQNEKIDRKDKDKLVKIRGMEEKQFI